MPTYGPPVQQPGLGPVLQELLARIQRLETAGPRGVYEIKLTADLAPIVGNETFIFAIPLELNGWTLTRASGFVSEASVTGGDVAIAVRNLTESVTMATIVIPEGANCGDGALIDPPDEIVSTCDLIRVRVDEDDFGGGEAEGAGAILIFVP